MLEDILAEIARRVGEGIATPLAIILITLIVLVLYVRSQQSLFLPGKADK